MTLFLLDANVLIRAHEDYYPVDRIPGFWAWLLTMAESNRVKMPIEIYREASGSPDPRGQWLRQPAVRAAIVLAELTDRPRVQRVIDEGYGPNLDEVELQKLTRDPFLIAAALGSGDRVVVTRERTKRSQRGASRKIPDVCEDLGIPCVDDFECWRRLDFRLS
jgi:hypothetical protein